MFDNSKQRVLVRDALKNAAIYGALADASADPIRGRDYGRLRDIEIGLARKWVDASNGVARYPTGRFSITLGLLKLASKFVNPARVSGYLRARFRRMLSRHSDDYMRNDLRDEAVESMELLDRLSSEVNVGGEHVEHGSLVTRSGALRAAVLGVNDGLVSNAALVLGVAAGTDNPDVVLLAGTVALVSGALSMAAGEYISVVSQREFNENLVRWERAELLLWHDEEEAELVEILQAKGLDADEAKSAAARIMTDPNVALDVHVREELGIDPDDLGGSPILASITSLVAFAIGAIVPLVPYIIGLSGSVSIFASASGAAIALLIVGGALGWLSSSGTVFGAFRMLLLGLSAAAITYGLGSLVGQHVG